MKFQLRHVIALQLLQVKEWGTPNCNNLRNPAGFSENFPDNFNP